MARIIQGVFIGGVFSILLAEACSGDDSNTPSGVGNGATGGYGVTGSGGGAADASASADGDLGPGGASGGLGGYHPTGGGAGTGGGTGSGATGGGMMQPECVGETPVGGGDPLIDDLEDGDDYIIAHEGRVGEWFIFHDTAGSVTNSVEPGGPGGSTNAMHATGSGMTEWGGGTGVVLNTPAGSAQAYDASDCTGITFWAMAGSGSSLSSLKKLSLRRATAAATSIATPYFSATPST